MSSVTTHELKGTVQRVVACLESIGLRYHLTGGVVVSHYGEPRFTYDLDVVVEFAKPSVDLDRLLDELGADFIVDRPGIQASIASTAMFQVLHESTFMKVDFHVGPRIPGELDRSVVAELYPGVRARIVSPEDALLSKLIWMRMGSHKARHDIAMIISRATRLDWALLNRLAERLGLDELLHDVRDNPPMA